MFAIRLIVAVTAAIVLVGAGTARADRIWGNGSFSYEHLSTSTDTTISDGIKRETLILSYEDALFVKNRLRLTANLQGRDFQYTDYHEFQPIYYLDLRSYGYTINARYSPYKRRSLAGGTNDIIDIYYRDWRGSATFDYDGWPTFSAVFSRLSNFDKREVHRFDGFNRNLVLESSYDRGPFSVRGNYNNLKRRSNLPGGVDNVTETYAGTAGLNTTIEKFAYVSTSYNYYDTRQKSDDLTTQKSQTHSTTAMLSVKPITQVSVNASYSGRFTSSDRNDAHFESNDQNMSARFEYMPVTYLTAFAGKGYQISDQANGNTVVEYLSLGATGTRYVRDGVDTRLTYNRTVFQQSQRLRTIRDTAGNVIGTENDGDYTVDTYNASLNFVPRPFLKTYLDMTLTHSSEPIDVDRRYQLTRSIDMRATFSRSLEGRLTFTSLFQGPELKLANAFSENYNAGLTWIPWSSMNVNLTYIHTSYRGPIGSTNRSFTGYVSYSFRRAFNLYVSYNRRNDTRERLDPASQQLEEIDTDPHTVNGQILMYLSRRTTLAVSYLRSVTEDALGRNTTNESIQTVLTLQI